MSTDNHDDAAWPMAGRDRPAMNGPERTPEPAAPPAAGTGDGSHGHEHAHGAIATLPRTAFDSGDPDDYAVYDGLAPQQQWVAGGAGSGESRYGVVRLVLLVAAIVVGAIFFGPYVFIIIGGLLVSIVLHEFGHYWTAKRCGMKVTEFFVSFGPRLWSFWRGETEYGIKLIPAGAYVRIIGMNNLEEVDPADEPRTYRQQSAPKRIAVVVAGPAMNVLIALVLCLGFFMFHGTAGDAWTVDSVSPDSSAAAVGIQSGDKVLTVNGESVEDFDHFRQQLNAKAGQQVTMVVERGGQQVTLQPTLGWRLNKDSAAAIPSKPALNSADRITAADGQPVATYDALRTLLAQPGDPVKLTVDRLNHPYELTVTRPISLPENQASGFFGVKPDYALVTETPVGALGETGRLFRDAAAGTLSGFGRLFTPEGASNYAQQVADSTRSSSTDVAQTNVLTPVEGSPPPLTGTPEDTQVISIVGIVQFGSGAAKAGWWEFLFILAMVNFTLALINLLPVLPFDGGHAVIAAYEGIRGKLRGERYTADLTKMMPFVYGVFGLLLLLGLSSVFLNIMNPVSYTP